MPTLARRGSFLCLLGVACLMVTTEARAQAGGETRSNPLPEALAVRSTGDTTEFFLACTVLRLPLLHPNTTTTPRTTVGSPPASPIYCAPSGHDHEHHDHGHS